MAEETAGSIILDLGKKKKDDVKKLRKGKGKLLSKVEDLVEDMKSAGELDANARPVIVVVRERAEIKLPKMKKMKKMRPFKGMKSFF